MIPCFNQINRTTQCVESISKYTKNFNFLFINNGSTDGTAEYLKTVPNSHIITNKHNIYVNPAWNQGFKYLLENDICDVVCLCNNDIVVANDWLKGFDSLFKDKQFYVPISNSMFDRKPYNNYAEFIKYIHSHNEPNLKLIYRKFVGCCIFFKRSDISYFYPIPETLKVLHGDDWINDNLFSNGLLPYHVESCAIYHHSSSTQRSLNLSSIHQQDHKQYSKLLDNEYKYKKIKEFDLRFIL